MLEEADGQSEYRRELRYALAACQEEIRSIHGVIRQQSTAPKRRRGSMRRSGCLDSVQGRKLDYLAWERQDSFGRNNDQERARMRAMLSASMSTLTPRQREMIELYVTEGLSMTQIAERLEVNISTVSRTLGRAMDNIRGFTSACEVIDDCARRGEATDLRRVVVKMNGFTKLQRRVILMALNGVNAGQISRALGCPLQEVESALSSVRNKLGSAV